MGSRRYPATDPREWLIRARSSLALAKNETAGALPEDLCFQAQQAAEKAVKAVFVQGELSFPRIHDLDDLLQGLERSGVRDPKYVRQADELTKFAVVTRYPGMAGPVTRRQYRRAVRIAESVLRWAERRIGMP